MTRAQNIERILKKGGVGVILTDTVYGIVGSALSRRTVARIYRIRRRNSKKPMIVLIGSRNDVSMFGARTNTRIQNALKRFWPGRVSVILSCPSKKFAYLHRGKKNIAFRLPAKKELRKLLRKTGPLVAPSANPEGMPTAKTIREAKKYFGEKVDFYADGGALHAFPSALVAFRGRKIFRLR